MPDIFGGPTMQDLAELWRAQPMYTYTAPIGETVTDDPRTPIPPSRHYAAAWQCGGCGTWYSHRVLLCECQKHKETKA